MKKIVLAFLFISMLMMTSCEEPTDNELFYEIQKSINSAEDYGCIADIVINSNKDTYEYKAKHIFKKPDKYLIEVLEPAESKGKITVHNGKQTWLYHPQINKGFLLKGIKEPEELSTFVGSFIGDFFSSEEHSISSEEAEEQEYIVISSQIPGNNKYRSYGKLWISKKTFKPYKLVIYDKEDNISVEVKYTEFKYNINIDDEKFNVETGVEAIKGL